MNPFAIRSMTPAKGIRGLGRLGATTCTLKTAGESATLITAGVTAGSAIAAGAAIGSVAGPIGAAVGAVAGIVAGLLTPSPNTAAHIGSWDSQLVNALAALPSTVAGVGRQIPWNEDSHGLVQYIEACLACGQYMSWDNQLILNYDVCAHWAMTLSTMVQVVATAVCKNKAGASVTVSLTSAPGGPVGPGNFTFVNPGISVGPEAVTAAVIMGPKGCMTWMFNRWQIASTSALSKTYATEMGSNAAASKVYALMVDYVANQEGTPDEVIPPTPVPDVTAVTPAASTAVKTAVASPPVAKAPIPVAPIEVAPAPITSTKTTTVTTPATPTAPAAVVTAAPATCATDTPIAVSNNGTPVTSSDISDALTSAGLDPTDPDVQSAVNSTLAAQSGFFGMSNTQMLIVGGLGLGAIYFLTRKK